MPTPGVPRVEGLHRFPTSSFLASAPGGEPWRDEQWVGEEEAAPYHSPRKWGLGRGSERMERRS